MVAPAGSTWTAGTTQLIRWSHNLGAGTFVRIHLSVDGGLTWQLIADPVSNENGSGSYYWLIPPTPIAAGLIRVSWNNGPVSSQASFQAIAPTITIDAPANGTTFQTGKVRTIKWTHTFPPGVPMWVQLSRDGGASWDDIGTVTPTTNKGSLDWVVTGPATATNGALIRVISSGVMSTSVSVTIK